MAVGDEVNAGDVAFLVKNSGDRRYGSKLLNQPICNSFKQVGRLKIVFRRPTCLKRTLMDIHIRA